MRAVMIGLHHIGAHRPHAGRGSAGGGSGARLLILLLLEVLG